MAERFSDWLPTLLATQATAETLASGLVIGVDVQAWDADLDAIAGLTPTDNKIMAGNGSAWVLVDRFTHGAKAAMLAADTDANWFRTDPAWLGEYFWDATVTIAQHQALVADERYAPPSAVADGAWVMRSADPRAGRFSDDATPSTIIRSKRLFTGQSAGFVGASVGNNGGTGSWIQTQGAGATLHYAETSAAFASAVDVGIAVSGVARNSAAGPTGLAIGGMFVGKSMTDGISAWGIYCEGIKDHLTAKAVMGIEVDVVNLDGANTDAGPGTGTGGMYPYGGVPVHSSRALAIGSGADATVNPTSFPADCAIYIANSGNTFYTGLVFNNQALEPMTSPIGGASLEYAVLFGGNQMLAWFDSSGTERTNIWGANADGRLNIYSPNFQLDSLPTTGNKIFQSCNVASIGYTINKTGYSAGTTLHHEFRVDNTVRGSIGYDGSGLVVTGSNLAGFRIDANGTNPFLIGIEGTLKRVTVGATDSGGAGFKLLRVPN